MTKLTLLTGILISLACFTFAQTPGLIYKTAGTGAVVLDPNGDGYTSTTTSGFTTNDQIQSEIKYKPLVVLAMEPTADPGPGPDCAFNDIVDSGSEDPVFSYYDGTNLLFRFRLGGTAPNSKGYSILIDSDQKFGVSGANADPNAVSGNAGFEIEIVLKTNFDVSLYGVDGTTTPVLKASYSYANYAQKSIALTTNYGDADYFYDFYLPFSAITTYFPSVTTSTPLRMVAVTSMNPAPAIGNNAVSDVGGIDDAAYGNNYDNIFSSVIDNFYPTSVTEINTGFPADRTPCPAITSSISTASTSISGTSSQANGTIIKVYKNAVLLGSTTVSSGTWSLAVSGLVSGNIITASATATGKTESVTNCTTITVAAGCSPDIAIVSANTNSKNIGGTGIAGATIRVYKNGVELTANPAASAIIDGTGIFCWKTNGNAGACNGGSGDITDGTYRVTQTEPGKCESPGVYICIGSSSVTTATPTISATSILNTATSVSGTSVASAYVTLYANGIQIGATTAGASSPFSWTISGLSLSAGQVITAKAISGTNCISLSSASVTVTSISAAPVIAGSYCTSTSISSISGTTTEAGGTVIELFSGVTSLGTTTSNATGAWTKTGLSIAAGAVITAKATAPLKVVSATSNAVTIGTLTSNSGLTVTGPITEGTTSVSGVLSGTGTVKIYIDQAFLGTATVTGTTWTLSGLLSTDLYAGASIAATITSGANCESSYSAAVIVQCNTPSSSLTVSPTTTSVCSGNAATLTISSSESGIIYQIYNGASASGSSVLGTGGTITISSSSLTANATLSVRASKIFPTGCNATLSTTVAVTIVPAIAGNILTAPAITNFCSTNGDASSITGNTPTGGNETFTYQWQNSTNGTSYTDISGATSSNYDPPSVSSTTYYRRVVSSGGCTDSSSPVTITISSNPIENNTITAPSISNFCGNGDPDIITGSTPTGGTGTYSYQWQISTTNTTNAAFSNISGATSKDYDPGSINATTHYRRLALSGCTSTTNPSITITVSSTAINNTGITAPATISFCGNGDPAAIIGATPTSGGTSATYTYQWQSSTNGTTWTNLVTTNDYDPGSLSSTTYFRRITISGTCSAISNIVTITITQTSVGTNTITAPATTAFCGNADPSLITGSTPTGGSGVYTYQWQTSINNTVFTDVAGETSQNYDPGAISSTSYYRRVVNSGACTSNSSSVIITISTSTLDNNLLTLPATTSFCENGDAGTITGSTPIGGGGAGTYTYQWQTSTDNLSYADIASATGISYDPASLIETTYYRRIVTSAGCNSISGSVAITITPVLSSNTLIDPAVIAFCENGDPDLIAGSQPSGGTGTYSYQWQSSLNNITFSDISLATVTDYNPPSVLTTTYFRRVVTSGICLDNSPSVQITITPNIIASNSLTAPATTTFCGSGDAASITGSTPTGGSGAYTYQWQSSTNNTMFTDIALATGINYDPASISTTTYFRRVVTSGACSDNSASVQITITPSTLASNTLTPPATTTFCGGGDAASITGSTPTGGSGTYTYQWQSSTNNTTFTDIALATGINYDPASVSTTTYFRRVVTSGACSDPSASVEITITPNTIASNSLTPPATTTFCGNGDAASITGSTPTGGSGTYTYQWQLSTNNTTFTDIALATGINYDPASVSTTTYFRRVVTSGACSDNSASVQITITPSTLASNTLTPPATTTFCGSGDAASITGSTPTGGSGTYTYQWQSSTNNTTFTDIALATDINYDPASVSATTYFRRMVTSEACSDISASVQITITPSTLASNTLTAPATTTFCGSGDAASITGSTPSGGSGTYAYQWQSSPDNTSFNDIALATDIDYDPDLVSASTYFRRVVTSGACLDNSPSVQIAITPNTIVGNSLTAPSTTSFCGSGDAAPITGSFPSGGSNSYSFQWQSSADNILFNNIASAAGINYDPASAATTTYFRRVITSGACTDASSSVTITITPPTLANNSLTAPATTAFCGSGDAATITGSVPTGGSGTYTYQWQSSLNNTTFIDIALATDIHYDPASVSATTYFRRVVSSGACSHTSQSATITITPSTLADNTLSDPLVTAFCGSGDAASIIGTTPTGGTGNYTYQWQSSADDIAFNDIALATSKDYNPVLTSSTTYFRRLVTSDACSDPSASVQITITPSTLVNNILTAPAISTFCEISDATSISGSIPAGGNGTYTYQWQSSPDNTTFVTLSGEISQDLSLAPVSSTTYFRRTVTSGACSEISNVIKLSVASAANSLISSADAEIDADGVSSTIITVQLRDNDNNAITSSGCTPLLATSLGTLSSLTDNGNGTYTATLTSSITSGTATITGKVGASDITDNTQINFISSGPSTATSTVTSSASSLIANGISTATITVRLKDANGNNITTGGSNVTLLSSKGTLSNVVDNGDGTYTAILTSSTTDGIATITAAIENNPVNDNETIAFIPGPPSPETSIITSSANKINANGTSTSIITVQLKDANGNLIKTGGADVTLSTTLGTLSSVTDNSDGTYTAILTSSLTAGTATITGKIGEDDITDNAQVEFENTSLTASISVNEPSIPADGSSTVIITIQAKDANGNNINTDGALITLSTTAGSISTVTDNGDGTYSAVLTSSSDAGTAIISGTINGLPIGNTATVIFTELPVSTFFIPEGFSPDGDGVNDTFVIQGAEKFTITLTVYNRWGNVVYEASIYKNDWDGLANRGIVIGDNLPDGTYFYAVNLNDGSKPFVRYMTIKRK